MAQDGRFGGRISPHLAQDAEMAFGSKKPAAKDSLSGQLKELEDKHKAGLISQQEYNLFKGKLESADSTIDYDRTPHEFEMGGNVSMVGRHGGRASDGSIGGGLMDTYDPPPNLKTWQGSSDGTSGRFGGRASDKSGARDAALSQSEQERFDDLKRRKSGFGGLTSGEEKEFEDLRDRIGRIGFKSAGAVRAKDNMATDPPVSEAQRRAMFAAKAGNSNIGIPQHVGKEFAEADPGGKLPEHAK